MMVELRKVIYVEPSPNFAPRVAWMSIRYQSQCFHFEMGLELQDKSEDTFKRQT